MLRKDPHFFTTFSRWILGEFLPSQEASPLPPNKDVAASLFGPLCDINLEIDSDHLLACAGL